MNLMLLHTVHADCREYRQTRCYWTTGNSSRCYKANIATMQLGRKVTDQRAMMVLTVDSDISADTLGFIGGVEGMIKVNFVKA